MCLPSPHTEPRRAGDGFQRPLVPRIVEILLLPRYTDNARYLYGATVLPCYQHIIHKNSVQQSMQGWLRGGRFLHSADHTWSLSTQHPSVVPRITLPGITLSDSACRTFPTVDNYLWMEWPPLCFYEASHTFSFHAFHRFEALMEETNLLLIRGYIRYRMFTIPHIAPDASTPLSRS